MTALEQDQQLHQHDTKSDHRAAPLHGGPDELLEVYEEPRCAQHTYSYTHCVYYCHATAILLPRYVEYILVLAEHVYHTHAARVRPPRGTRRGGRGNAAA